MNKRQVINYIEKVTRISIDIKDVKSQRFPWNKYQFTYFSLSTGVISAVRTLLDREFVNRKFFENKRRVKDFFLDYSQGKSLRQLKWFDFFLFTVDSICKKTSLTLPEIVNRLEHLSRYLSGRKGNPLCPRLTKAQIVWALLRRYGVSFNSFLTEIQVVEKMSKKLPPYRLKIRKANIEEDIKGTDFVVYNDEGYERKYNLKTSKYDEGKVKDSSIKVISMSSYVETGDLKEEHYKEILQKILEDACLAPKKERRKMLSRDSRFR
jgi:hypothetical protein